MRRRGPSGLDRCGCRLSPTGVPCPVRNLAPSPPLHALYFTLGGQMADLTIDQALAVGIQVAQLGDHPTAAGLFRAVLKHEPESFDAMVRLGVSLFEMQRTEAAFYWLWRARQTPAKEPDGADELWTLSVTTRTGKGRPRRPGTGKPPRRVPGRRGLRVVTDKVHSSHQRHRVLWLGLARTPEPIERRFGALHFEQRHAKPHHGVEALRFVLEYGRKSPQWDDRQAAQLGCRPRALGRS